MADTIKETHTCNWDLTLQRGNDTTNRSISFDIENTALRPDIKDAMRDNLIPSLTSGMSKLIQPTGWRDNDETEEEWTCTGVEVKLVSKTETTLDI